MLAYERSKSAVRLKSFVHAPQKLIGFSLLFAMLGSVSPAQSLLEISQERDPAKRSELALAFADEALDHARDFYRQGAMEKGDAALENMTTALDTCMQSLTTSNKARLYKKAELKIAYLQRRLAGVVSDLNVQERGWAEQMQRRVEEIRGKILDGVMRK
jgi:hypothetical protein